MAAGSLNKQRENAFAKEHGTVCIMQIGGRLKSGQPHDGRAPDYDDWTLNCDILFWHKPLDCALELSSMGIRVDADALRRHDPELSVQLQHIVTQGDKILDVPLARIGGKGLFTTELERRLLDGTIDLAVHSLKDLPADVPDGLCLAAITARHHVHDAFVSNTYTTLESLPAGACIGTSSLRRRAQLLHTRPDLVVSDLRGNVDTRLKKLDDGQYDAIILAEAGLQRLGRADRICQLLPVTTMIPAVGQGALAIETRADDMSLRQALAFLNDQDTAAAATAERAFLAAINGSCQVPVGVYGTVRNGTLTLQSIIAAPDGSQVCRTTTQGPVADSAAIGKKAACTLLDDGGRRILTDLGITPIY